jgi:flavin-dependent thymidylate synthase
MSGSENVPMKWADRAMFAAEPQESTGDRGVLPKVTLLSMTADPLGAIGAMAAMYEGRVIRDLSELSDVDKRRYWDDVMNTHLTAPLEAVKLHFMIEGVDRAFTHQMVRQRTAVYAQESMRFAVLDDLLNGTTLPPSLWGTKASDPYDGDHYFGMDPEERKINSQREVWDSAIRHAQTAYQALIEAGMPAEEARGLLPHATATRLNYVTDLRALADHAGNRLCTQAQWHWRIVFTQMVEAIRNYGRPSVNVDGGMGEWSWENERGWQYHIIANSKLFRPVCYQLGKCPFKASFDRACSIRDRVDDFAKDGVPSSEWHTSGKEEGWSIDPNEWLADPSAARRQ